MTSESSEIRLTPTSFIVLGLLERREVATPYELKGLVAAGIGNFWSLQHAQLYTETARLASAGYLTEEREEKGRRRRLYRITDRGRAALREWINAPTDELLELRDLAMLKLFFGADPDRIAAAQLDAHRQRLAQYEHLRDQVTAAGIGKGPLLTLEAGIDHEREFVRFWSKLAKG
jgi:DNA-binding PadR family transcriptional regulator